MSDHTTHLAPEDHQAFFDALENPPAPTDKLRAAFARHECGEAPELTDADVEDAP